MSKDTCKVLVQQMEAEKQYMTGLREMIAALADLAAKRATVINVSAYIRKLSYGILAAAGAMAGVVTKQAVGRILGALAGIAGVGSWGAEEYAGTADFLQDKDYQTVQGMIDEAEREFLRAEQRIRQLRREYRELGCQVK